MRRIYSTLIAGAAIFAFTAGAADAQTIGAKLGASFATLSTDADDAGEIDRRTGFAGGGFIRFGFGRFGIQAELLSVSKGASLDDTSANDDDLEIALEYVEIPVLVHLPLSMGTSFSPYVFAGPAFAFEVGCEVDSPAGSFDCDNEGADLFSRKSTDIGLAAGAGVAFAMGPGALLLEGRYTWGMSNLNDVENDEEIKNRAAYLMAGYEIPLSRGF